MTTSKPGAPRSSTWLPRWEPNDPAFWESEGKGRAWRTLWVTTFSLTLAFAVWFMVSAIVVRLNDIGFSFSGQQLFWLTAMPGLAAGITRLVHMFLVPMYGSRHTLTLGTLSLLIPAVGWGIAVQNPETSFTTFMVLAFLAGLGGGNFSSFMPSTSLFFPKKMQGTALGIQAGIGNFGVSLVQFLTPWVVGVNLFWFIPGGEQVWRWAGKTSNIWLQNAAWVYIPWLLLGAALTWLFVRSVPIKANFREQFAIFGDKHTWIMTSIYMMTFGAFSGLAAAFPLLIKNLYGGFENAPLPLKFAFLGPLIGSTVRVLFGLIADRTGGAILTSVSAVGMAVSALLVANYVTPTSLDQFPYFVATMLGIFFFSGIGNASTFRQMPIIFNPPQSAGVIGWTAAIAAFGPFIVSMLISTVTVATGNVKPFFYGLAAFCLFNLALNWYFYGRRGAEKPS
ncbi:nitrate/nitrite transporter [Deinococcus sp. MIMF12]|uniref:Nitrate/nitrite transporter n=1 Tax=Deinococcus rhizophilus TaxID=3049544 RepID=A0ABT7JHB8_9DEIO|nr:nitrate/nitrite transporter [Deinococcus rhizophilus]MDL2344459.1 nitrate/nitrite transporter [Deinococcus rhizophilus]